MTSCFTGLGWEWDDNKMKSLTPVAALIAGADAALLSTQTMAQQLA